MKVLRHYRGQPIHKKAEGDALDSASPPEKYRLLLSETV